MATLIVGDLHGQFELVEAALDSPHKVVFVGDYLNSFTRTVSDMIITLETVLSAAEFDPRVTALRGNHERSYTHNEPCSGFQPALSMRLDSEGYFPRMDRFLNDFAYVNGWLITHAGLSNEFLTSLDLTVPECLNSENYNGVGYSRGGWQPCGGIFWCDFRSEFVPVPGLKQVFGHTRGNHIRSNGSNYCVDVLENNNPRCGIIDDDGQFRVWHLLEGRVDEDYHKNHLTTHVNFMR